MKSISVLCLSIALVSTPFALNAMQNAPKETLGASVATSASTGNAYGTSGNYGHNYNHGGGQINPQTIITTIEDIITIVEAVSSFVHTIVPASNTATPTASSKLEPRKLSDDDVKKIQDAHDLLKASILKIFEKEEKAF
jgi:hypothetical protein